MSNIQEIKRMATREGFVDVFWLRVKRGHERGKMATYAQVYALMESECLREYGDSPFPSYTAFRLYRDRRKG